MATITSPHNPAIKQLLALRERRERERTGLMRVEGYDELALALDRGARPAALYYCPALVRTSEHLDLLSRARTAGAETIELGERVFARVSYRDNPDGWLATLPLPRAALGELTLSRTPLLLVAEAVEKPGNLGAMLRTADAAGVDAVIAVDALADWGNPNVVRASRGALFSVAVATSGGDEAIAWLRERGIAIVAALPEAALRYERADLRGPVAIAVGEEHRGLGPAWRAAASVAVRIPMYGAVNSLNVSVAAALLVYEAVKQRTPP